MTHNNLIDKAVIWLKRKCVVVSTEIASGAGEEPDAIGWQSRSSTLIECKATKTDFKADCKKIYRRYPECGMGKYRYYMVPGGLIKQEELPQGWGLLEARKNKIYKILDSKKFEYDKEKELSLLLSILRRIGQHPIKGTSIRCYQHESKNRAALYLNR